MSSSISKISGLGKHIVSLAKKANTHTAVIIICIFIVVIIITAIIVYYRTMTSTSRACAKLDNGISTNIRSLTASDEKCKYTLKDYYIKTSYNSCSVGEYRNGFVSTCILKDIIRQGVRGIDFEIYSEKDKPVVATSTTNNYYVKETYNSIYFNDIMKIITQYAFNGGTAPNYRDPIILHLRFKSGNSNMYQNLAEIFKQYKSYLLSPEYSYEYNGKNLGNVSILEFGPKIIIVVDKQNSDFMKNKNLYEFVNMTSSSVFMQELTFSDVQNIPNMQELQNNNKTNMTMVIPNKSSAPENSNGIITRELGCQFTAMQYQHADDMLQESDDFFNKSGYAFVLKPKKLRYEPVYVKTPSPQTNEVSFKSRKVEGDFYSFNI